MSEVLNALDMPGAVNDIKRFNYVCKVSAKQQRLFKRWPTSSNNSFQFQLVQLIINEKLNQLSGNAQRTLFIIVKEMLIQGKFKVVCKAVAKGLVKQLSIGL